MAIVIGVVPFTGDTAITIATPFTGVIAITTGTGALLGGTVAGGDSWLCCAGLRRRQKLSYPLKLLSLGDESGLRRDQWLPRGSHVAYPRCMEEPTLGLRIRCVTKRCTHATSTDAGDDPWLSAATQAFYSYYHQPGCT